MTQSTKNIVLVHGGFVDGSGWESVYSLLKKDAYNLAIVLKTSPLYRSQLLIPI